MKLALTLALMLAAPALAETHEVQMYTRSENGPMIYEPQHLVIAPGDEVRFVSAQPGHNAATIEEMLPEGAEAFRSELGADFAVTLTVPGRYGIKCSPHYAMGMVMLVDVGEVEADPLPEGLPPRAAKRFEEILAAGAE